MSCLISFNPSCLLRVSTLLTILNTLEVLIGTNLKVAKKIGEQVTHRIPNSPFYNDNEWDYHFAFPSRKYCLGFRAIPNLNILREFVLPSKLSKTLRSINHGFKLPYRLKQFYDMDRNEKKREK